MFLHCTYILKIPAFLYYLCNYICNYTADPSLKPILKPTHTTRPVPNLIPYHTSIAAKVIYNTT